MSKLSPKDNKEIVLFHYGSIGELDYHQGKDEARIVIERVDPCRIKRLATYELSKAWR